MIVTFPLVLFNVPPVSIEGIAQVPLQVKVPFIVWMPESIDVLLVPNVRLLKVLLPPMLPLPAIETLLKVLSP